MTERTRNRPFVVLSDMIHADAVQLLEASARVDILENHDAASQANLVRDMDAIIVRKPSFRVGRALIEAAPRLRIVGRHGAGVDNVDVDAATESGIIVTYTPGANTASVAQLTIGLVLAVTRKIVPAHQSISDGAWARDRYTGIELSGLTLGIIGVGRIGRAVAKIAAAMDMRVVGFDPYLADWPEAVTPVALADLLRESDVITVHAPLTAETRGLVGRAQLAQMKRGAIVVNTARGGIVDETALCSALASGQIGGAGIDAFENEPLPPDHPLARAHNVVLTPHLGAVTDAALRRMGMTAAEDVLRVLAGQAPRFPLNPQVRPRTLPGGPPGPGEL
jgi:D-3-phosphoglycerate dehydrogenase / 2-oxoglutarate reductase